MDKAILGQRYTCFQCGTKFYDLNREDAICPECSADQAEAPVRDMRDLLKSSRRKKKKVEPEPEPAPAPAPAKDDDDDVDDVDDLFDDDAQDEAAES